MVPWYSVWYTGVYIYGTCTDTPVLQSMFPTFDDLMILMIPGFSPMNDDACDAG